ncbi:hypothetical protein AB0M43_14515 [Longispora sp. NPDC051575]|uniref:hypothetical protein n=1 Tax=Longispora sp. NPDC051575 TaxID=3154943 RepID=UPI00343F6319
MTGPLELGATAVFSGEWLEADSGPCRYRVGYTGVLVGGWKWPDFDTSLTVVREMCAEQDRQRDANRAFHAARGLAGADLEQAVDDECQRLWLDGKVLVRDAGGDLPARRIEPAPDGTYCIDLGWPWRIVDATDCQQIIT